MKLCEFSRRQLDAALAGDGVWLQTGPFISRIQSRLRPISEGLVLLYPEYSILSETAFADFHVKIFNPWLRRWWRPQVQFSMDSRIPFKPLPANQAFPLLEWGLNWCITSHSHNYLIIHSAVIEKNGLAVILPGTPGSGKSTLCAGLVLSGWRLLSDEMAVIDMETLELIPVVRPISLKNASIDVIGNGFQEAIISPPAYDTLKGTVAHMRAPRDSVERMREPAKAGAIVFPCYDGTVAGKADIEAESRGRTLLRIADNTFNYSLLGEKAFRALTAIVQACQCFDLRYRDMEDAIAWFEDLAESAHGD